MPEHIQYQDDDLFNPETHHESSDVPIRPLFVFIVIFIVFAIVSHIALWFLYKAFVSSERKRMDPPATAVTKPADAAVPKNQPLLQPFPTGNVPPQRNTPVSDLADMRAAEDRVLHNYGWVDRQKGIVHIPIERAKELMAARLAIQAVTAPATATVPASPAPAGNVVPPDTGAVPPATTSTAASATPGGHS